jgi:hypothetical protein
VNKFGSVELRQREFRSIHSKDIKALLIGRPLKSSMAGKKLADSNYGIMVNGRDCFSDTSMWVLQKNL